MECNLVENAIKTTCCTKHLLELPAGKQVDMQRVLLPQIRVMHT